ncbi:Early nodulin 93 ENOD93 protein [Corchorus olitorius]|uniref:Early nodulin 93 ENOD93 protein n=1 Tax=Corchorus olitorius TaxID=93759 RepID=A0A1R3IVP3_9ROSI|nr:Early nodulin 93 ENOD93 protein [Corchorus olitorius]
MGIPSEMRDAWIQRRSNSFVIPSPAEDERRSRAARFSQEGVYAGLKAAAITAVVSAVPTLIAVRKIPWAKANLNHTAQALIISGASIAAYFITVDKTVLESARSYSRAQLDKTDPKA